MTVGREKRWNTKDEQKKMRAAASRGSLCRQWLRGEPEARLAPPHRRCHARADRLPVTAPKRRKALKLSTVGRMGHSDASPDEGHRPCQRYTLSSNSRTFTI